MTDDDYTALMELIERIESAVSSNSDAVGTLEMDLNEVDNGVTTMQRALPRTWMDAGTMIWIPPKANAILPNTSSLRPPNMSRPPKHHDSSSSKWIPSAPWDWNDRSSSTTMVKRTAPLDAKTTMDACTSPLTPPRASVLVAMSNPPVVGKDGLLTV